MCSFLSKAGGACCGRFIAAISAPAAACRRKTRMTPSPGLAVGTPLPDTGGHAHVRLEKLDHLRFVACLMVMIWHFSHAFVPATVVPSWTWLSLIEEGHTGVSLFCVISGFIFGWLYYGRSIVLRQFARNRALRILPIFLLWLALAYVTSTWEPAAFMVIVFTTLARYQLPSYAGPGWSILVEMQFYALFPFLISFAARYGMRYLLGLLCFFVSLRFFVWADRGYVQDIAYWTLFGRIDQFLCGMLGGIAVRQPLLHERCKQAAPWMVTIGLSVLAGVYAHFNQHGGWQAYGNDYPSRSFLWVVLPAIEGTCYATVAVGYVTLARGLPGRHVAGALSYLGRISYSLYACHGAVLLTVIKNTPNSLRPASWETSLALFFGVGLPAVVLFGTASYFLIERPFLEMRGSAVRRAPAG